MAVALRSRSDLVYVPDHGFVGEDGALRILVQVNRQIRRIDMSQNLLGPGGLSIIVQGLTTLRSRFSSPEALWGMRELNLAQNELDDTALQAIMNYVKKDVCMERLLIQGNNIRLLEGVESIIHCLNSSNLHAISLNQNILDTTSIIKLFDTLDAPHLSEMHLSTCHISSKAADSIAKFLNSPRCRSLNILELNGNQLGAQGVRKIVDVIETSNHTIKQLGLFANDIGGAHGDEDEDITGNGQAGHGLDAPVRDDRTDQQKQQDASVLSYQVHERLPPLLERNRRLTRRIRDAALKCLYPGRLILTARPASEGETAQRVIRDVGQGFSIAPFRILDLPSEVIYHIVRHMSDDPWAFSSAQFVRLRTYAEDRSTLRKASETIRERLNKCLYQEQDRVRWEIKEEWLRRGKWDKWELDKPVKLDVDELLDDPGTWFKLEL